jgi:hypothetical protein
MTTVSLRILTLPTGLKYDNPLSKAFIKATEGMFEGITGGIIDVPGRGTWDKTFTLHYNDDVDLLEMVFRSFVSNCRIYTTDRRESDLGIMLWDNAAERNAKMIAGITVESINLDVTDVNSPLKVNFNYQQVVMGPTIDEMAKKIEFFHQRHNGRA